MPMSLYYSSLRQCTGTRLLLMPAVAGVVRGADGRVLVQKNQHGRFSLPGGAIEPGEHPAQALVREVVEETGLCVRPLRVLALCGGHPARITYPNGDEVEYVVTVFECTPVGGALLECPSDETLALEWYAPDAVPRLGYAYAPEVLRGDCQAHFAWDEAWLGGLGLCAGELLAGAQ
jgi:8-oxo-dGTP pyrophosphatase MutT (NUDIX family)